MKSQLVEQTGQLRLVESKTPKKGCLGRLEGPCADFKNPTRNGRLYGLQLWKNVFDNKFVKEALNTKTLFGELDHPEDRFDVLAKYACVCMTDYTIDESKGLVYGGFDILDTEAGRILKSLVDYGSQMGVSSRGEGDIIQGENGEEVDPDTYDFACFDVVSTPAVERARQTVVESVEHNRKKRRLLESIENEINNADTVEVLDNIERTVTNCNCPNLSRIRRSIKNRKSHIIEGKNISSVASNNSANSNSNSNSKYQYNTHTAKTIRENVSNNLETVNELNSKIRAYKLREKQYNKNIQYYKNTVETLKEQLNDANRQLNNKNTELKNANKALKESNNIRLEVVNANKTLENKVDNSVALTEHKNVLRELSITKRKLREQKTQSSVTQQEQLETNKQLRESIYTLKKDNNSLNSKIQELENLNETLNAQLAESDTIIESFKNRQEQLKQSLKEEQSQLEKQDKTNQSQHLMIEKQNRTIQELEQKLDNTKREQNITVKNQAKDLQDFKNSVDELENTCNSLQEQLEISDNKYNALLEKFNALQAKSQSLVEKLNQSLKLNKQYTNSYLSECATNCGVNPNSVSLKESIMGPAKIKQLVEEVKDRQDRYNQLPISYEQPTTINILKEDINKVSKEDNELESFLTSVQGQF